MPGRADDVQQFYERYPYPRPVESLGSYRKLWRDPHRRRVEHFLARPREPFRAERSILVAGCGTSQAAKHAMRWPEARVVGIDLSANSVRCTEALAQRYGLHNLDVRQLSIERVSELATTFDEIVCTGVLHHLVDPAAGLRALRAVLAPAGMLHLMLYAPYGRAGIYMLQDFCRRLEIAASDEGIRDLVAALALLPAAHPLATLLREAPDFQHEAALADALLHPQDRAYSVPQVFELLAAEGFAFVRWARQAPYSVRCGLIAKLPQAAALAQLPLAEQYAAIELFRGTMVRHSLIARRDDAPAASLSIDHDCVPLRVPDTICVRERLPPGAAGVLINRSHTCTDLYRPIDTREKRLFDAVDGRRTLGELAAGEPFDSVHAFFETLWWHDLVVFA